MVPNSGAYAVPGWWWYYNQTAAQVATLISTNNARLIELERYVRSDGQDPLRRGDGVQHRQRRSAAGPT